MKTLSILHAGVLQPWGVLNTGFNTGSTSAPDDWLVNEDSSQADRQAHFNAWFKETLDTINRLLWPKYDPQKQEWQGDSIDGMEALTLADLEVMLRIQAGTGGVKQMDSQVSSTLRSLDWKTQGELFGNEDELRGGNMFKGANFYDRTLDDHSLAGITHLCFQSGGRKIGNMNDRMKNILQRPRALQTALRYQRLEFEYRDAGTSVSPSMCSGHCLQGTSHVGALIDRLAADGRNPTNASVEALARFAVDIGDRRVLAGVHYPADNLCSWIIFLRLLPIVYNRPDVVSEVGKAIDKSYVLGEVRAYAREAGGKCYEPALAELDRLLP